MRRVKREEELNRYLPTIERSKQQRKRRGKRRREEKKEREAHLLPNRYEKRREEQREREGRIRKRERLVHLQAKKR